MLTIQNSGNAIIRRNLFQADGTDLLLSSCNSISVQLLRGNTVIATYTYGTSPEVREGEQASQLEVEVKSALTKNTGKITMDVLITISDASFVVDRSNRQRFSEEIINVV